MNKLMWRKSSRSTVGECVEVAVLPDRVLVRDIKDPDGSVLSFAYSEWRSFTRSVTEGEFDL